METTVKKKIDDEVSPVSLHMRLLEKVQTEASTATTAIVPIG